MRKQLAKLDSWNPLGTAATTVYVLFICLPVVALLIKAGQQSDFLRSLVSEQALLALRLSLVTSAISIGIVILVGTPFARLLAKKQLGAPEDRRPTG